jgi:hypothetical protein
MVKLFIKECLLFHSKGFINWLLGVVGWISLSMFIYAIFYLAFYKFTA